MRRSFDFHWLLVVLMGCHAGEPLDFFVAGERGAPAAASPPEAASTSQHASDASSTAVQSEQLPPFSLSPSVPDRDAPKPTVPSSRPDAAPPTVDAVIHDACPPDSQCEGCEPCADRDSCISRTDCALEPCDAGSCGDAGSPLGAACASNGDCESGFCVEGFCCDGACNGDCEKCGADGRCNVSPALDFACEAVSCPLATTCRSYIGPPLNRCAEVGRCAGLEECVVYNSAANVVCGDGLVCDGNGACVLGDGSVPIEPAPVSPSSRCNARGVADGVTYYYCYDYAGNVMARGFASPEGYLELFIPPVAHGGRTSSIFAFDEHGNELCGYLPAEGAGYFVTRGPSCVGAVTFDFYARD